VNKLLKTIDFSYFFKIDSQSTSTAINSSYVESEDSTRILNTTAAAAAKRKGSFKKWLRSSHRKFTSNTTRGMVNIKENNTSLSSNSKTLNLTSNADLIENLKIKVSSRKLKIIKSF